MPGAANNLPHLPSTCRGAEVRRAKLQDRTSCQFTPTPRYSHACSQSSVGVLLRWTRNTFSVCCHQLGWQQIRPSLTELQCQILSPSWYVFFLVSESFTELFFSLISCSSSLFTSALQKTKLPTLYIG